MKIGRHSYTGKVYNTFNVQVSIGDFTSIANGLTVIGSTGQHGPVANRKAVSTFPLFKLSPKYPAGKGKGPIVIGNDVWIGTNVILLDGITIGDGAIIGAGAVIAKNVPPYAVAVGNPFVVKKYRFEPGIITKLQEIKWWNWPDAKIVENIELFSDIEKFVAIHAKLGDKQVVVSQSNPG